MIKRVYDFCKKNIVIIFFFVLILVAVGNFQYILKNSNKNYTFYEREDRVFGTNVTLLPFQTNIDVISQDFIAEEDNLSRIDIYINNVSNREFSYLTANMTIGIKDVSGKVICEHDYSVFHFYNSNSVSFTFPKIKDSKGKKYTLYIKRMEDKISSIVFAMDVDITGKENTIFDALIVDDDKYDGSLYMTPMYELGKNTFKVGIIVSIISIFIFLNIYLLNKCKKLSIEENYFIIALIICLATIILTPLFYGKDETSHWARAYEISEGHMLSGIKDGWPTSTLPKSIFDVAARENFTDSWNNLQIKYNNDVTVDFDMQYMSVYSPISYLPTSVGIFIANLFTDSPAICAYYARFVNTLVCLLLLYLAMKIIPFGKKLLFTIGLIPTTVNSFSTITADGFLVATSILLFSYILNVMFTKNKVLTKKDYIILVVLSSIISLSKLVYLPFLFVLLLLIRKEDSTNQKIKIIGIITVGILINMIWGVVAFEYLSIGQGLNSKYYIIDILVHPLQFIQKFIYTWYINGGKYISDLFGGNNSWYGTIINDSSIIPIAFILICLILVVFDKECHIKLEKTPKILISVIMLVLVMLISTSLYISCTPIGFSYFVGIQGRYFLPLLLPSLLLIGSFVKIRKININTKLVISLVIYFAFVNLLYVLFLYL